MYFDELLSPVNDDDVLLSWSEIVGIRHIFPELRALQKVEICDTLKTGYGLDKDV